MLDAAPSAEARALAGLTDVDHQLRAAILSYLRVRARLATIDRARYRLWIQTSDADIKALTTIFCRLADPSFDLSLEPFAVDELFPMDHVERASTVLCLGLMVDGESFPGAVVSARKRRPPP